MSQLLTLSLEKEPDQEALKNQLKTCRKLYKSLELFIGYFTDVTEKELNGPLLIEVEDFDPLNQALPPQGLQVLEELLFQDSLDLKVLRGEIKRSNTSATKLYQLCITQEFASWQLFDAMRDQIRRIMSLGLNNFDSPYAENCLEESAHSLRSMTELLNFYPNSKQLRKQLIKAAKKLERVKDYESFNKLTFIKNSLDPIYQNLHRLQRELAIAYFPLPRPVSDSSMSIFELNAWNPNYFGYSYSEDNQERIALGQLLFFDPILSGNTKRSCASCHQPDKYFSDGLKTNASFDFQGSLERNTPSLLNVSLQQSFFWDNRVSNLEEQAKDVTTNHLEMHGNFDSAIVLLNKSSEYRKRFQRSFPSSKDISARNIQKAIAAYERTLIALNSPFDQYMRGEIERLDADVQKGFNLFMGKAQCGTCHFFPLFNGTLPPHYRKTEAEIIGIARDTSNKQLDPDPGKYKKSLVPLQKHAFKTTPLRNIQNTAPYMHNGAYPDLKSVMLFYNNGGGAGHGLTVPNQTLSADSLNLNELEMDQIILFLNSLSDTSTRFSTPSKLPSIEGYSRSIGGEY